GPLAARAAGGIDLLVRPGGGGGPSLRLDGGGGLRPATLSARPRPPAYPGPAPACLSRRGAGAAHGRLPARGEVAAGALAGPPGPRRRRGARRDRRRPGGAARPAHPRPGRNPTRGGTALNPTSAGR